MASSISTASNRLSSMEIFVVWASTCYIYPCYVNTKLLLIQANIFIDDAGEACLADFGMPFILDAPFWSEFKAIGPCRWTAPEVMDPPDDEPVMKLLYSKSSDVYSFGMTMLEVCPRIPARCLIQLSNHEIRSLPERLRLHRKIMTSKFIPLLRPGSAPISLLIYKRACEHSLKIAGLRTLRTDRQRERSARLSRACVD